MHPHHEVLKVVGPGAEFWSWRVPATPTFNKIATMATQWNPSCSLAIAADALREALGQAARQQAPWLLNPLVFAVGLEVGAEEIKRGRDFQLAVWLAAHGSLSASTIVATERLWLWGEDGSFIVDSGVHEMAHLAQATKNSEGERRVLLDVWCHTHRLNVSNSWAQRCGKLSDEEEATLLADSQCYFGAIAELRRYLPECLDWVLDATSVVIPLRGGNGDTFSSRSSPDLPGLIEMDLANGVMAILEALVHETAHQYFYRAEAANHLIELSHNDLHHSPLRKEPRPLRGVFLAWHALAFICLLYQQAAERRLYRTQAAGELPHLLHLLTEAESVISAQRDHLTEFGDDFFRRTALVADRARC